MTPAYLQSIRRRQRQIEDSARVIRVVTWLLVLALTLYLCLGAVQRIRDERRAVHVATVVVEPGDTLWAIWSRTTGQRMNWNAWLARVERTHPRQSSDLTPGETLRVLAIEEDAR